MRMLRVKNEVRPEEVRQQFVILRLELPKQQLGKLSRPHISMIDW